VSGHSCSVNSVCWNNDGTKLASGSDDSTVKIWNPATGECLWTLSCDSPVLSIDWHENRIGAGCDDGTIRVFDAQSGDRLSTVRGHNNVVSSLAFKPDDPNVLVTGSWDKTVKLWDLSTSTCLSTMRCDGSVCSIDFVPCGNKFAIACNNYNSSSYSVQIFSQEGSTGNFACQSTLWRLYFVLGA